MAECNYMFIHILCLNLVGLHLGRVGVVLGSYVCVGLDVFLMLLLSV